MNSHQTLLLPEHQLAIEVEYVTHSRSATYASKENLGECTHTQTELSTQDTEVLMRILGFKGTIDDFKSYTITPEESKLLRRMRERSLANDLLAAQHEEIMHAKPKTTPNCNDPVTPEENQKFFEDLKKSINLNTPQE